MIHLVLIGKFFPRKPTYQAMTCTVRLLDGGKQIPAFENPITQHASVLFQRKAKSRYVQVIILLLLLKQADVVYRPILCPLRGVKSTTILITEFTSGINMHHVYTYIHILQLLKRDLLNFVVHG